MLGREPSGHGFDVAGTLSGEDVPGMRYVIVCAVFVAAVALLAVVVAMRQPARRPVPCSGRIVIMRAPRGEPLECVCVEGVLSTCFSPGP